MNGFARITIFPFSQEQEYVHRDVYPPKDNDGYLKKEKHAFILLIIYLLNENRVESESMRYGKIYLLKIPVRINLLVASFLVFPLLGILPHFQTTGKIPFLPG